MELTEFAQIHMPGVPLSDNERKPHICPVCGGKGLLPHGFYIPSKAFSSCSTEPETCRTCGETGVIWG